MVELYGCDFEVFGTVQGVFFRKNTQEKAQALGIKGWCENTASGTVRGQMEGRRDQVNEMKHWLETKGSPMSKITKAVFTSTTPIEKFTFAEFDIKRRKK